MSASTRGKDQSRQEVREPTRRQVLLATGTTAVIAGVLGFLGATARYLYPNVLYEPPSRFPVGLPDVFPADSVTFLPNRRLFIFNGPTGFYAISSICTHLGCNVKRAGQGFACPCHGSRFDDNGLVTRGPAPAPLAWYALALSPRGDLIVDLDRKVAPDFRLRA